MNLMPNTIAPRTPLTVTELETLAAMLDSASQHLCNVRDSAGVHVWDSVDGQFRSALDDMFTGFFQLRDNTCVLAAGPDGSPFDRPESNIRITAGA
jgi:hypothetical protein